MATVRAHVVLPTKLVEEIDALVGTRGRSAFFEEVASAEVKRRKLKAFLAREEPAWTDENHPDIAAMGSAGWVRQLREEESDRQKRLDAMFEVTEAEDSNGG